MCLPVYVDFRVWISSYVSLFCFSMLGCMYSSECGRDVSRRFSFFLCTLSFADVSRRGSFILPCIFFLHLLCISSATSFLGVSQGGLSRRRHHHHHHRVVLLLLLRQRSLFDFFVSLLCWDVARDKKEKVKKERKNEKEMEREQLGCLFCCS